MTAILAIDPGTTESGYVAFLDGTVKAAGVAANGDVLRMLPEYAEANYALAVEMMYAAGMPAGNDQFRTLVWIGRFQQAWREPDKVRFVDRRAVKLLVCGSPRAKDPNIRAALLDLVGPQGTRRAPGPTYGVHSHAWAALAVAVTAAHQANEELRLQPPALFREPEPEDVF